MGGQWLGYQQKINNTLLFDNCKIANMFI